MVNINRLFSGTSKVDALLAAKDWTDSVLGDPSMWPQSLRSVVRLILNSKFPMFVAWGPQLGFLYNDAYAEIMGSKHPESLGLPFHDVWNEIWSDISPIIDSALSGQPSYFEDLPLLIERSGHPENAWFTFSYSPVHDDDGTVAGMYCSVVETTKVVQDRRLREFQLILADKLHRLTLPGEMVSHAVEMLAQHLSANSCWYAEIDDKNGIFSTKSGWFAPETPALPRSGKIDDFSPSLLPTLKCGKEFAADDIVTDPRTCDFADKFRALNIAALLIVPIIKDGDLLFTINVTKPFSYVWTEQDIQAAEEVANRTWVAMANAISQQRLQMERDRSDHILNQMGEGFMLVGVDGCILKINAEGLRILGLPLVDVVGKSHLDLWPDDVGSEVTGAYQDVLDTGTATIFELDLGAAHPRETWLEMRVSSLKSKGLAVFFRDITEHKRALVDLRRSQEHLSSIFEQTAAGIAERDLAGCLISVNERFCKIVGRSREDLLGENIRDLIYADDLPVSEIAFNKLLSDGQSFDIEKRYIKPDGILVWVSTTVSLIHKGDNQRPDSVLAVVHDINERKRAEEALQDETRILELLNNSGKSLASTLDLNTLLQSVTDSGRELTDAEFGAFFYNGQDECGDAFMLYTLSGASRDAVDGFGHPRATPIFKPTFDGEPAIRSDDITQEPHYGKMPPHFDMAKGHLPVRSYLAAPVISRSGDVIGGLFFGHSKVAIFTERSERLITGLAAQAAMAIDNARLYDLTHKAAEDRQTLLSSERAARAEAERLNRAKDEFLAMLAHELRNPLAPVSAAAEILRYAGNDPKRVSQVSDIISRQIAHFTRLIDDLMDVSRVTRGLIRLETEPLDIKAVISAAIEQVKPMIEARQHSLKTFINAESTIVNGDRTRLVQVVANLLTNAAKYTPAQGEILLKVETDNEHAKIVITDNGDGIEASLLPHMFDLFTQGARGLDRTQGGLGIGLALVRAIVTLHHGEVQAFSNGPGTGSKFTVSIPRECNNLLAQHPDQSSSSAPAHPVSILLVDDNVDAAHALSLLLNAVGYRVVVAANAIEAMKMAEHESIDVFLLDIGLPDMNGYDLAKALQRRPALKEKIYFALTGYAQPQDRLLSKEAGFAHHFVKPVNTQHLFKALGEVKSDGTRVR